MIYLQQTDLKNSASLWLDLNRQKEGEFFSYGIARVPMEVFFPDRVPQPEMWQIKKSAQPFSVKWSKCRKNGN
jgi:beta-galactosidase